MSQQYRRQFASLSLSGLNDALARATAVSDQSSARGSASSATSESGSRPHEAQSVPEEGGFEVDEEAADRALERTLVQTGVLLLPFGQMEVEPSVTYVRREVSTPSFLTEDGVTFLGTDNVRRNVLDADLQLRFGLPFDAQLDLGIPYRLVDQSTVTTVGFSERGEDDRTGHGLGDVRIGLAKTLLREGKGWADVVGRLAWDSETGERDDRGVALGGGFTELSASLSAVKRQDPLAFIGGVSYRKTLEKDDIEPGDRIGVTLGALLAASPQTSLRFVLGQTFVDDLIVDGTVVNGSDQVIGTMTLGASSIVGRKTLVDVSTAIGLTDDAPDYSVRASLGTRFDLDRLF